MKKRKLVAATRIESFLRTAVQWSVSSENHDGDLVFYLIAPDEQSDRTERVVSTDRVLREFVTLEGEEQVLEFLKNYGPLDKERFSCRFLDLLEYVDECRDALRHRKLMHVDVGHSAELRLLSNRSSSALLKARMTSLDIRTAIATAVFVGRATGQELRLCAVCLAPFIGRTKASATCGDRCRSVRSSQALRKRQKQARDGEPYIFE